MKMHEDEVDIDAWERALDAPTWKGTSVWTPTCSGPTCWFTMVGSPRSSTSAGSGSAIQPLM